MPLCLVAHAHFPLQAYPRSSACARQAKCRVVPHFACEAVTLPPFRLRRWTSTLPPSKFLSNTVVRFCLFLTPFLRCACLLLLREHTHAHQHRKFIIFRLFLHSLVLFSSPAEWFDFLLLLLLHVVLCIILLPPFSY